MEEILKGRKINKYFLFLVVAIIFVIFPCHAENIKSPFNGLLLDTDKDPGDYSFFVAAHLFGSTYSGGAIFPSASIQAAIDMINDNSANIFIALGDIYFNAYSLRFKKFNESFASKVNMPIFNAVGDHDVSERALYEQYHGKTYFSFIYGKEAFIFIDTEMENGNIKGEQLKYFKKTLQKYAKNSNIKNVFIFGHRLIWSGYKEDYSILNQYIFADVYPFDYNFNKDIVPCLVDLSKCGKSIYWFTGDGDEDFPCVFFYAKDEQNNIQFVITQITDTVKDAMIKVNVNKLGEVKMEAISLTRQKLLPVESYNLEYWKKYGF